MNAASSVVAVPGKPEEMPIAVATYGEVTSTHIYRIRGHEIAERVARGVARFNGIHVTASRILAFPHYKIVTGGKLGGWIGVERRRRRVFEICHLSVLPRYRRHGLAEAAVRTATGLIRRRGGTYACARINRHNHPSRGLFRKLGFRITRRRHHVLIYGRAI